MEYDDFEDWYVRHHRPLVVSMVALSGDREVAHDATDEAFARALANWTRVRAMPSSQGWVYQVALNVLRRSLRRRSLEARLLHRQFVRPADLHSHPEVWEAVRALPERQRQAVVLRYVADLPEADIAHAMGVTRGTVASTLYDARRRLARDLAEPIPWEENRCEV